jgi:aspartyl-tRNA(Asn)/glutamyl-tRNA(Gln) amidotransferase subunit A
VPIDPPYVGRVAGPLTRTVADTALMMASLSLPDQRDYTSIEYDALDWTITPARLKGLKIGLLMEAGCGVPPTAEVRSAVTRAARDFEAAGAHVEPIPPFLTQAMLDGLDDFWRTRALIDMNALTPDKRNVVLPFIRDWAEGAEGVTGDRVFRGFSRIQEMSRAAIEATQDFDFVLSPTAPLTAYPAEWASPSRDPANPFPHIGFTVAFNMSGQPAVSIPCGFSEEGLPVGLQIVGRRFDDVGVLSVAQAFEEIRSAAMLPWPEPPGL